jgi:hypothetical protein
MFRCKTVSLLLLLGVGAQFYLVGAYPKASADPQEQPAKKPSVEGTKDVQEQIDALTEELRLIQAVSGRPEVTAGPFGRIVRVSPNEKQLAGGSLVPIVLNAMVGVSAGSPDHYRFDLLVRVRDAHGDLVVSGFSSTTVNPGTNQDTTIALAHFRPKDGEYTISSWIRARKLPLKANDPGTAVMPEQTYRYTVR